MLNWDYIYSALYRIYNDSLVIEDRQIKHNYVRDRVMELADSFGCEGKREYRIFNGRLDTVWLKDNKPFVSFEVESSLRQKSIKKLMYMHTLNSICVYLYTGKRNWDLPDETNGKIVLIRLRELR